ncbi:MAG: signal peptidase II [Abditibacteriota bacterium]|nr:signal peptidase II [Abditibacteriota bacterium]MBP5737660.1 signal peptidase II [Abditibacteriota bacterium]
MKHIKDNLLMYLIFVIVLAADQITKAAARHFLADGHIAEIMGDFLGFELSFNPGAAFGTMQGCTPLLLLIAVVAIFIIVRAMRKTKGSKLVDTAFALLLSGAVGNSIDRALFMKVGVTDFIRVAAGGHVFPNFNIADSALTIGVILLFIGVMAVEKREGKTR